MGIFKLTIYDKDNNMEEIRECSFPQIQSVEKVLKQSKMKKWTEDAKREGRAYRVQLIEE